MKINKYIIIFFFLWNKLNISAQNQIKFNKIDTVGFLSTSVISIDSSYYTIGDLWNHEQYRSSVVKKFNKFGELINHDTLKQYPNLTSSSGEIFQVKNGIIVTSAFENSEPYDNENRDILISKYDDNLNLVFEKIIGTIKQDFAYYIFEDVFKNIFVAGQTNFQNPNGAYTLIKLDSLGNLIWQKIYPMPYGGCRSACRTSDNGFVLSGFSFIPPTQTALGNYDSFIIKLDSLGNEEWRKNIGTPFDDGVAFVEILKDETILVSSSIGIQNSIYNKGKITKINLRGDQIWTKQIFYGVSTNIFYKPIELNDGCIIITGFMKNNNLLNNWFIQKIDPLGNSIWKKDFLQNNHIPLDIYGIKQSSDGGIVFCGAAREIETNIQRPWLVKLDCFGCDGISCDSTGVMCESYDCTTNNIDSEIIASSNFVDLNELNHEIIFSNASNQITNRKWIFPDTVFYNFNNVSYSFYNPGIYNVQLINYHGTCSDSNNVLIHVFNDLNLNEGFIESPISIFPNPNKGYFKAVKNNGTNLDYKILNNLGQEIYHNSLEKNLTEFDLKLEQGVYYFIVNNLEKIFRYKIVIQ